MRTLLSAPRRRSLLRALAALTTALAVLTAGATAGSAAPDARADKGPRPEGPRGPWKTDRDRDKLYDELEQRLAGAADDDRVDVIVLLHVDASAERLDELARRVGAFERGRRFSIVDAFAATVSKRQAEALAAVPWVAHVEENSVVRATNAASQQSFGVTKAVADAPSLDGDADGSADAYSPRDLVAAVVDTGIDARHLDLDEGKVLAFRDFVAGRTDAYDDNGHGTHVAATIAGDGDARADRLERGVAPAAGLVGLKVLDGAGSGTMANVTAAIDWVVQNKDVYGIEAINLSLGTGGCSDGTDATSLAVDRAEAAGLVVAVAAGNDGAGTCTIGAPGAARGALTVGAMADLGAGGFGQAPFSSRGRTADGRIKPDVSAPGVGVLSAQANTTSGYVAYSGTSMATPFVAGLALLMRDADPSLTPAQVRGAIVSTAIDWGRGGDNTAAGSTGPDVDYGAGRLDAFAALKVAGAAVGAAPAAPAHVLREGTLGATGATVDYRFDVGDVRFPVAATMIVPAITGAGASSPDFDLYLYGPGGALVDAAETTDRQESVAVAAPVTGTYTLRVRSYAGSGGYFVDVSAGLASDTTPPTVTGTTPAAGATGVTAGTTVSVAFSEPMDAAATGGAFSLARASDGVAVAGSLAWSGTTLSFAPAAPLTAGTTYRASISTAARDTAGNALAAALTWTFTVAAAAPVTTSLYPSSIALYAGSVRSGTVSRLQAADGHVLAVNSTTSGSRVADWYGRITGVANAASALSVTYRGRSSATCTQQLGIYNWTASTWTWLDTRSLGGSFVQVTAQPTGTLADFVGGTAGDGDVAVRVRCSRGDASSFFVSADLLRLSVTR